MSDYRLFGSELSPYSVKVRSILRYKRVPHEWIQRTPAHQEEFARYAKLPLVPLLVTPEDQGMQDSTPIALALEAAHPQPAIQPPEQPLAFLSLLLEEFADEWGNKWMFHYRWAREVDQISAATRIAESILPSGTDEAQIGVVAEQIRGRMTGRVGFVGSSEQTAERIERSFTDTIALLEVHLASCEYLFGARPSLADFGLWGQLYECWSDPTTHGLLAENAPHTVQWIERLVDPRPKEEAFRTDDAAGWLGWEELASTLEPLLEQQVGRLFLPWSVANARALAAGDEQMTVELDGELWQQQPQKYHAKSLQALRAAYRETAGASGREALDAVLERTGCLSSLSGAA